MIPCMLCRYKVSFLFANIIVFSFFFNVVNVKIKNLSKKIVFCAKNIPINRYQGGYMCSFRM